MELPTMGLVLVGLMVAFTPVSVAAEIGVVEALAATAGAADCMGPVCGLVCLAWGAATSKACPVE